MDIITIHIVVLSIGFVLDQLLGDPRWLPHPIVAFGNSIAWAEKCLNKGKYRLTKGAFASIALIVFTFALAFVVRQFLYNWHTLAGLIFDIVMVFYCLAAKTLRSEVSKVFDALQVSLANGRKQLSFIVGRDTQVLNEQQVKKAALETLSENLSDGIVAPLFWFMLLGTPGMLAYKMINTLDSMIGYKSERYKDFGCWAAKIDDAANYVPARLTAIIMLITNNKTKLWATVAHEAKNHASPNSGYPEAALANLLNCRFGGPAQYFGQMHEKKFIGTNERWIEHDDLHKALTINIKTEWLMLTVVLCVLLFVKSLLIFIQI